MFNDLNNKLDIIVEEIRKDKILCDNYLGFVKLVFSELKEEPQLYQFAGIPKSSLNDTIKLCQYYLDTISKEYRAYFDKLVLEQKIRIGKNDCCVYDDGDLYIELDYRGNLKDAVILIHEFFHSTNIHIMNAAKDLFGEFISIYFENNFLDFLRDQYIISEEVKNKLKQPRLVDHYYGCILQGLIFKMIIVKDQTSKVDFKSYEKLDKNLMLFDDYSAYLYDLKCIMEMLPAEKNIESVLRFYKYLLGNVLVKKNIDIRDVIEVNNNINLLSIDEVMDTLKANDVIKLKRLI